MKSTITSTILALAMMASSAAFAETAQPVRPAKPNIDKMTTQSIDAVQDCNTLGAKLKYAACGKTSDYPENALSGLNLGY